MSSVTSKIWPDLDGSLTDFEIPFEYLSKAHVKATLDGSPINFDWLSTYTVKFDPAPVGELRIYRETPKEELINVYQDGSILIDDDLNASFWQSLMVSEEVAEAALAKGIDGHWDAGLLRITNASDPVDPQDVVTKQWAETSGTSVLSQTITARDNAYTARDTAVTAKDNAVTAKGQAEAARDAAIDARNAAQSARDLAQGYSTTALGAKDDTLDAAAALRDDMDVFEDTITGIMNLTVAAKNAADGAASAAAASASTATTKANEASVAKGDAEDARDLALAYKTAAEVAKAAAEAAALSVDADAITAAINSKVAKSGDTGLGGFVSTTYNLGNSSGKTIKPDPANGNYQALTNDGNFTLQAPDDIHWSAYSILIRISGSGGTCTATGFTKVYGQLRTSGNNFATIRVINTTKVLVFEEAS